MSLTNGTADALATAICSALGVSNPAALANWKTICEQFYSHLKTDIVATISAGSINTAGSAAAQVGPPAPVLTVIS
jgi:hypothetical protein